MFIATIPQQLTLTGVSRDSILRKHLSYSSVVIVDFNIVGISVLPAEDDPPLIVDPDAVLPTKSSFQRF
jgi:hypothetical protein